MSPDVSRKLDQGLLALAQAARSKDPDAVTRAAKDRSIELDKGLVHVQLTVDKTENVAAMEKLIADVGGQVTTHLNVAIFATLPVTQLEKAAADPRVWNILIPGNAYPMSHHLAK